jgi:hypothetical protein
MADIDRIELLIGLSNNMRADNEAWRREVYKEGFERYKKVMQMRQLFEQEYANIDNEARRLEQYAPTPPDRRVSQEQMPKAVTQGPKS